MADAVRPSGSLRLNLREDGDGMGPPLVLLHTIGTDLTLWDDAIDHLPASLRLIRLDLRGHGISPTAPTPGRMGALIADVEQTLDSLALRDVALLGHGLGGLIAQGLATKRLDLVRALILSGTTTKIGTRDKWAAHAHSMRHGNQGHLPAILAHKWLPPGAGQDDVHRMLARIERQSPEALAQAAEAMASADFYTTTAGLRLPTLCLVGARDAFTPPDLMRETHDLVPGSQFALIPKAGHLAMLDAPAPYAANITDFLSRIGHPVT